MRLILCSDAGYVEHAAVLLHSVFAHHRGLAIEVHLVHPPALDRPLFERLARFVSAHGSSLHGHVVPQDWLDAIPDAPNYVKSVWLKVFAPALVPGSRALYLDLDMIVRDSLLPVWQAELGGAPLAAVQELIGEHSLLGLHAHVLQLGLTSAERYFNTGLMLFDLERCRAQGLAQKLRDYAADASMPRVLVDQDAYNHAIRGDWQALPLRYNASIPLFLYDRWDVSLPAGEIEQALADPAVVHFCSPDKPWKPGCFHPHLAEYRRCRRASGFGRDSDPRADPLTAAVQKLPLPARIAWYRLLNPWVGPRPRVSRKIARVRDRVASGLRRRFAPP